MKNLLNYFVAVLLIFAINSCAETDSDANQSNSEMNENFVKKYTDKEILLVDLKNIGIDVNSIGNIQKKYDGSNGIILDISFVTVNGKTKNIIYTNTKSIVKFKNGLLVKNNQSLKKIPSDGDTTAFWCADCDGCQVQWDLTTNIVKCSKSCCALYIKN